MGIFIIIGFLSIGEISAVEIVDPDLETINVNNIENSQVNEPLVSTGNSYSVAQIEDAATRVRNFIQVNKVLPNYVTINKKQVSMPDFLHILSTTTINLGQSKNTPLTQYTVTAPTYSPEQINSGNIQKAEYLQLAQTIKNHIETTTKAPPSITSSRGTISYESTIYMFSRIIAFHGTQKTLPNFATINNWNGQKLPQNPPAQPNPTPEPQPPVQPNPTPEPQPPVQGHLTPTGSSYTVAQIENAALRVRNFIQNNRVLPNFVTINNRQVKMPDFLHMLTTATLNLNQRINSPLTQYTVTAPTYSPEQINSGNIQKAEYLQLAQTIKNHIETTTKAPPSITSSRGTISYESTIYMYSRIIAFHGTQKTLPNFATINNWIGQKLPASPPGVPVETNYAIEIINYATGGDITRNSYFNQYMPKSDLTTAVINAAKKGTPMITFGDGSGPKVMITAGVHGDELPAPIAAMKLINYLDGKVLKGTVYIVPFVIPVNSANSYRYWNGKSPNKIANVAGSPTNVILKKAQSLSVIALGDYHSTRPGGDPGEDAVVCSKSPNYESFVLASYIAQKTGCAVYAYNQAGVEYPGALEDVANLAGIVSVTPEVTIAHGYASTKTVNDSYAMMLAFLDYYKII
ncbi:succinylglutamate desuccinylase/aspartoacylase family protein [Methanobacterium alkalithermotolerans]|uniref:Succinylglutamate desuccinylase/aspartoacylase family protein n=1 Tax=Methanobacterium alkalithermotolerans TaxID=2731220 RepID=A0A8T8K8J5_9EURY|nr:pseudomurein-binding repeat-containing protein [Methanobacterium alkalithermotolerans]QUH24152.1 succinylglutamate desuccinylase/aspartoacylase family protein [Methanobacterium alkalithermotolerans]